MLWHERVSRQTGSIIASVWNPFWSLKGSNLIPMIVPLSNITFTFLPWYAQSCKQSWVEEKIRSHAQIVLVCDHLDASLLQMIHCPSPFFNDPFSTSLKHLWLEHCCGTHHLQQLPPPTDLHLHHRETIVHVLQKQHPTNRLSVGSKWLFHNQCYFPQMRHISYCHLVPWQVICQTAGSCMLSVKLYWFPSEKGERDWRLTSTLKRAW